MAKSIISSSFSVQTAAESYLTFRTYHKSTSKPAKPTTASGTDSGWSPANTDGAVWVCEKSALTISEGTWGEVMQFKGDAGTPGARGMLPFPAGEYDANKTYTATANTAPFVLLAGTYYVMNKAGNWLGSSTGKTPAQDYATNGTNATWIPFENFKAIYAELLFAKFGLLGSAVFYDDYMLSQHGVNAAGVATSDYRGFNDGSFIPNLMFDFKSGAGHLAARKIYWDSNGNAFFKGSIFNPFKEISTLGSESPVYLDFSTGFNLDISRLIGYFDAIAVYLPSATDYFGAQCLLSFPHVCTRVMHSHPEIRIAGNRYFSNLMYNGTYAKRFTVKPNKLVRLYALGVHSELAGASVEWYVDTPENVDAVG